jgi:hypothetical protein
LSARQSKLPINQEPLIQHFFLIALGEDQTMPEFLSPTGESEIRLPIYTRITVSDGGSNQNLSFSTL